VSFAYIKASEGEHYTDPFFAGNWADAKRVGIRPGAYHFYSLCATGAAQAHLFLTIANDQTDALAPAVDLEMHGQCSSRPSVEDVYRELDDFFAVVEHATGKPTVVYLGDDFDALYPIRIRYHRPLWLRSLDRRPDGEWTLW